jgi:hypothetical protein
MRVFIALQRRLDLRVSGILFLSISSPIIVGENRDLAVSHERIGHVLSAQGDLAGASVRLSPKPARQGQGLFKERVGNDRVKMPYNRASKILFT